MRTTRSDLPFACARFVSRQIAIELILPASEPPVAISLPREVNLGGFQRHFGYVDGPVRKLSHVRVGSARGKEYG